MAVKSKFYIATSNGWVEANFGGTGSGSFYGVSEENTANRTVALTNDDDNFELVAGATVNVKFTYASSSGSMTLNVNKTGAKTIKRNGSDTTEWKAGAIVNLVYDGTDWIMSSGSYLPLSGGTLTGALTLPSRDSVWGTTTNIAFSSGGKITGNTLGNIGIQGTDALFFRPSNVETYQMDLDSSGLHPKISKKISLGTSSYYWNNIYGTTIYENGTSLASKYATIGSRSYLTPQHSISAGDANTHYYKLITIKPTSTAYLDLYYEFDVVARANKYAKIRIYVITNNDNRYISSVYVNSDGALGIDNFKAYKFTDTTNKIDRVEVWCKVTSWDTLEFYPKTSNLPSALSLTWNKTEGTAFPTDATSTITIEKKSWIGNAATATKATQDGNGNKIVDTYATKTHVNTISNTVNSHSSSINTINATFTSLTSMVDTTNKRIALPRKTGTKRDYIVGEQQGLTDNDDSITVELPPVGGVLATREWVGGNYSITTHNHDNRYYTETEMNTKLAGKADVGHEHPYIVRLDTRDSNATPYADSNYSGKVTWHLKGNSTIGISGQSTYSGVLQLTPWGDKSGGPGHQLAFGSNGAINHRYGDTEWSSWKTLIDSGNIGSQSVNYATSAGSATKATKDGAGNTITTTYVAKADKPTASTPGPIYMKFSNGILTISDEKIT